MNRTWLRAHWWQVLCGLMLLAFATLSYSAAAGKSATSDEPLHAVGGYIKRHYNDFRVNPENPPLFGYWAALPHSGNELVVDVTSRDYRLIPVNVENQWDVATAIVYRTPTPSGEVRAHRDGIFERGAAMPANGDRVSAGTAIGSVGGAPIAARRSGRLIGVAPTGERVEAGDLLAVVIDAEAFINRSRLMFTFLALGLGMLICWWSWKIAGATAAVTATALFSFDPNFLAHSSLITNDVALSLLVLALAATLWLAGKAATPARIVALAAICAAAVNFKYSGVLLAPMTVALLTLRALLPQPWHVWKRELRSRSARAVAGLLICFACLALSWVTAWAAFGFRYAPLADGGTLNTSQMVDLARANVLMASTKDSVVTLEQFEATRPDATVRTLVWAMDRKLLPHGWLYGFLYTYATTRTRPAFLLGQTSLTGWWYYFPLAMLFKTPLATLLAIGSAAAGTILLAIRRGRGTARAKPSGRVLDDRWFDDRWLWACLVIPATIYAASALTSNLNIGLRHILPVYPFLFVGVGIAAAGAARLWPRRTQLAGAGLAALLLAESVPAYPDYIPFFNRAALSLPGAKGGLGLIGDSNLDWGQDLPRVAKWQKTHRDRPLFFAFFGNADPHYYGIEYFNLPYGYMWGPDATELDRTAYIAISAFTLQGTTNKDAFEVLRKGLPLPTNNRPARLIDVLGKSIYIYEWER